MSLHWPYYDRRNKYAVCGQIKSRQIWTRFNEKSDFDTFSFWTNQNILTFSLNRIVLGKQISIDWKPISHMKRICVCGFALMMFSFLAPIQWHLALDTYANVEANTDPQQHQTTLKWKSKARQQWNNNNNKKSEYGKCVSYTHSFHYKHHTRSHCRVCM